MSATWPAVARRGGGGAVRVAPRFLKPGEFGFTYQDRLCLNADQSAWVDGGSMGKFALADLVEGEATAASLSNVSITFGAPGDAPAALRTDGAMTALLRINVVRQWVGGLPYGFAAACGDFSAPGETGNFAWSILVRDPGQNTALLRYFAQRNGGTIVADATPSPAIAYPYAKWRVLSLRRNAAGDTVRMGLDGSFVTVAGLQVSTPGAIGKLTFMEAYGSTSNGLRGQLADFNFAPVEMSDVTVKAAASVMLGRAIT